MRSFWFTIRGKLDKDVADQLWRDIKEYNVNLTVLDEKAYIYGKKDKKTIAELLEIALRTELRVNVEVGID